VVAASNELPEGEELAALFDRFLVRFQVAPVSDRGFETLLGLRGAPEVDVPRSFALDDNTLREIRAVSREVAVGRDVMALLTAFRDFLAAERITVSDRRWRKIVGLLQVAAWTNGRDKVSPSGIRAASAVAGARRGGAASRAAARLRAAAPADGVLHPPSDHRPASARRPCVVRPTSRHSHSAASAHSRARADPPPFLSLISPL
jgi:MoxR-like ATPase